MLTLDDEGTNSRLVFTEPDYDEGETYSIAAFIERGEGWRCGIMLQRPQLVALHEWLTEMLQKDGTG